MVERGNGMECDRTVLREDTSRCAMIKKDKKEKTSGNVVFAFNVNFCILEGINEMQSEELRCVEEAKRTRKNICVDCH